MPLWMIQGLYGCPTRIRLPRFSVASKFIERSLTTNQFNRISQKDILTVLHHTDAVLPRLLPLAQASRWSSLIGAASDILTGVLVRRPRIAVWGTDELAQATELVSALLDDPLTSDKRTVDALRNRRIDLDNVITIGYGDHLNMSNARVTLNLSWLRKHDVDIIEIPSMHPEFKALLYDTDIQLIVTSPLSTTLPRDLESLLLNPTSFLIINHPIADRRVMNLTRSRLVSLLPSLSDALDTKIFQVYPPRALSALDAFREASNSATAIQAFQTDFLESGVTALSHSISQTLSSDQKVLESRHAQLVLSGALEACRNSIEDASHDAAAVQMQIDRLHMRIDEAHFSSVTDVLGGNEMPVVTEALNKSTREMQETMNALQWWKLLWEVDDLGDILSRTAERAWCRDLEAKLQLKTGRLSVLCSNLVEETHANLRLLPPSFHSAILVNTLHQISVKSPDLSPNTLTYPLNYRLQQLQYPILSFHRRAQHIVLVASTTALGSVGGTYTACLLEWITPSTALGLGALGIMAGVRWLVGKWEKGKKRWWEDWHRIGEGLRRDLKGILALVMRDKVTAVPITAADELSSAVALRLSEIQEMKNELKNVEESSRHLHLQQKATTM